MLARWIHPLSGVIGPDIFIPVAEEIGLIGRLSDQVIGDALRKAATHEELERLNEELRRDRERLASTRDRRIAEIRKQESP